MIHLHVHTEYSALDGMSSIDELIDECKKHGQTRFAVTDHGNVNAFYELEQKTNGSDIVPIYGCEFYTSYGDSNADDQGYHIICLAKNQNGLKSLYKLHRLAYDNFYRKPQLRLEDLLTYGHDLIVMSACIGGMIPQSILKEDEPEDADFLIKKFKSRFGEDFYLEIQPTDMPDQMIVNKELFSLGKKHGVKIVATNDVHYTYEDDAKVQEVMLAMQFKQDMYVIDKDGNKIDNPKRYKFVDDKFFFRTEKQMLDAFMRLDKTLAPMYQEAINNTHEVANKCTKIELIRGDFRPHYNKLPEGKTEKEHLADLTRQHIREKFPKLTKQIAEEVAHELKVIDDEGYSGYFLIVQDYIKEAQKNGILIGDGRGSGAGSKVAYINDITKVDPVKYGLLFERFLDHGRIPDIDTDVSDQEWIFKYFQRIYGKDNVARVIAFGTLTAKLVTRRLLQRFGFDEKEIAKVIGYMPGTLEFSFQEAMDGSENLRKFFSDKPFIEHCIRRLEGRVSNETTHAGGMVIHTGITDIAPVKVGMNEAGTKREIPCVCYSKYPVEDIGFVKIDVLGLKTLTILQDAKSMLKKTEGIDIDLRAVEDDDPNLFRMMNEGRTHGVFQVAEQAGMLQRQKPQNFEDLTALTSLIRPGTGDYDKYLDRRFGKEDYTIDPNTKSYMQSSEGLIIYQEQYLQLANTYANWKFGFSDKHIRKNKKLKTDNELKNKFISDTLKHYKVLSAEEIERIWEDIVDVAGSGYGFNRSHAVCYTKISMQTAYMKFYYPTYFYSAMMNMEINKQEAVAKTIAECKREGIKLLAPQLNCLSDTFVPDKNSIQMPLNYLKGVGKKVIPELKKLAPIKSLNDLWERREPALIKKNVIENMIKAGCFDFEADKEEMFWKYDCLQRTKTQVKKEIFPERRTFTKKDIMTLEREALGMNLELHPLSNYNVKSFWDYSDNERMNVTGLISDITVRPDRSGKNMAFIQFELPSGIHKALVFSSIWAKIAEEDKPEKGKVYQVNANRSANDLIIYEFKERDIKL